MSDEKEKILRETRAVCPTCLADAPARVVRRDGAVYLQRDCPAHGTAEALLSRRADYYQELMAAYFELMPGSAPQRDYIVRLTGRCNMQCPICLASADDFDESDLTVDDIDRFAGGRRRLKLDLMGAEPTLHGELVPIIRRAKARRNIVALHTNGKQLRKPGFLEELLAAGLDEVHLQCDGFDDEVDQVLRGEPMGETKHGVLAQLERHGVATDLVVTILRGVNEAEMGRMLDYAAAHSFVTEVFYLGCRRLGRAADGYEVESIAPDELIDELEARTGGRVAREDIRVFQKLYFAMLALFRVRKCFYIHHYIVLRAKDGYQPVAEAIDLPYLEPRLDRFRKLIRRSRIAAAGYLTVHGVIAVLRKRSFGLLFHGTLLSVLLAFGFDLSRVRRRIILLGFITACDPWIYDEQVAANCGKGELASDIGAHESGAAANVEREHLHRRIQGKTE